MASHTHGQTSGHDWAQLPAEEDLTALTELFKALSDPTRVRILWTLSQGQSCVVHIAEALGMTQSAISHQLRVLKGARLVKNTRDGRNMLYELDDDHVTQIFQQGLDHVLEK
ncbi:ArsR/SmtB family transcription factor [Peptococcus simiae]|uniref:ArsR/SmtB family transcription factor n=1 Tax=Peptococcus simiae TaxID=1643805 RepID=A0ABW9H0Y9_9FIRM